jgi:hypothetical protein
VAEFETNSDINISTDMALFMATKGYISRSGLKALISSKLKGEARKKSIKGNEIVKRMNDLRLRLRNKLF